MYIESKAKRRKRLGLGRKQRTEKLQALTFISLTLAVAFYIATASSTITYTRAAEVPTLPDACALQVVICEGEEGYGEAIEAVEAHVTGYNTVPEQTDETPCIAASGDNICGRDDVVACPRHLELGTRVEIDGKEYVCLDRTAPKFNDRYDISCDKDTKCPARVTGYKTVLVLK